MARFSGKSVIVTGSSSGIGRAAAVLFAREGAQVTITGRKASELEKTKKLCIAAGASKNNVHIVVGDVTKEDIQKKIIDETISKFGKLNVLVNNAGANIVDPSGKVGFHASYQNYVEMMKLNVNCIIQLLQLARDHLIKSEGEVVNVSSIAALEFGDKSNSYYSIAKAALDQLTRAASIDFIEHGVRVNGVNPGPTESNFLDAMGVDSKTAKGIFDSMSADKNKVPRGQIADPAEIAAVIAFLADRQASSYIIGQCIVVDGGTSLIMALSAAARRRDENLKEQKEKATVEGKKTTTRKASRTPSRTRSGSVKTSSSASSKTSSASSTKSKK